MNVKIPKDQTPYKNIAELFGQRYRRIRRLYSINFHERAFYELFKVRFTGKKSSWIAALVSYNHMASKIFTTEYLSVISQNETFPSDFDIERWTLICQCLMLATCTYFDTLGSLDGGY